MPQPMHFTNREDYVVLDAVSTGAVLIGPDPMAQATEKMFYVVFSEGTSGGAVEIATAHSIGFGGRWSVIKEIVWDGPAAAHAVSVPGVHLAIRIRVTKPIVLGTVTVLAVGS